MFQPLLLAAFAGGLAGAMGCEPELPARRCNSEADCALSERCADGICTESNGSSPEAPIEPDAAPEDAGQIAADAGQFDGGVVDGGGLDAGPIDGGQADAGPLDAGPLPDWWDDAWETRERSTLALPAGNDRDQVTLPVVIPADFAEDPSLRVVIDGVARPFEVSGTIAWIAFAGLGDTTSVQLDLYKDGPETAVPPHVAAAWPDALGVWHFDGHIQDSSSAELHGSEGGIVLEEGIVGPARRFRSTGDMTGVRLPAGKDIVGGHVGLTMAAWVRVLETAPGQEHNFISISRHTGGVVSQSLLSVTTLNTYRFRTTNALTGGIKTFDTDPLLTAPEQQWAQVVAVADLTNRTIAVYLDGELIGSDTIGTLNTAAGPATQFRTLREPAFYAALCAEDDGIEEVCDADLDEVRIFGRALSAGEVALMAEAEANGGLVPVDSTVTVQPATAPAPGPAAVADSVTVGPGAPVVIDVLANDGNALAAGTVVSVVPATAETPNATVRIRSDGQLDVQAIPDAAPGTSLFDVTVSDGRRTPTTSPLEVSVIDSDPPSCAHLTSNHRYDDLVTLELSEFASEGQIEIATAHFGSVDVIGDAVTYQAPVGDPRPATDDIDIIVASNGLRCRATVTIDLTAGAPLTPADVAVNFDHGIRRFFRLPLIAGSTGVVFDPVFRPLRPKVFAVGADGFTHAPTDRGVTTARFHYVTAAGSTSRSAHLRIQTQDGIEEDATGRIRVRLNDTAALPGDVDFFSALVDMREAPASAVGSMRFFAAGSAVELPSRPEGTIDDVPSRFRVRVPKVYADTELNYFWAYFGGSANTAYADDSWSPDVVGAWGFSEGLEDQSGNEHHAAGEATIAFDGVTFGGPATIPPITIPSLADVDFDFPFSVEVVFEPSSPWNSDGGSMSLVTRYNGDSTGNYHLVYGSPLDYTIPENGEFESGFAGKFDSLGVTGSLYEFSAIDRVDPDVNVLVHSVTADGLATLFHNGSRELSEDRNIRESTLALNFDGEWQIGPGTLDTANVDTGFLPMDGTIRSVRFWKRAMEDSRAILTAQSERGALLDFGLPEPAP